LGPRIGQLVLTMYVLNKAIGISALMWMMMRGAIISTVITWVLSTKLMTGILFMFGYTSISVISAIRMAFLGLAASIGASVVAFMVFYRIGQMLTANLGVILAAIIALAVGAAMFHIALTGGLALPGILAGWGTVIAVGASLGLVAGVASEYLMPSTGTVSAFESEDMKELEAYMAQLEEKVSASYGGTAAGNDLYVDNLYTANDDLAERAYSSSYTTTTMGRGAGTSTEF